MRQPTLVSRRIGTKGFCGLAAIVAVLLVYGWCSGELAIPWPVPLISVVVAMNAFKARREVDTFNRWQRNWNAMAGITEPVRTRNDPWRRLLALWLILLVLVITQPFADSSGNGVAVAAFAVMTLWWGGKLVWKAKQTIRGQSATSSQQHLHIVHTPLPVPRRAPGAKEATAALPDYCLSLLRRERDSARQN